MKKFFAILLSLIMVTVVLGACTHNKVYGTVVVTPEKYKQISADKAMIEDSIKGLKKFNSENPESEQKVIRTLNTLIEKGQRHLNKQDRAQFKRLLGSDPTGVKGIVKNAYDHQRGFDDDLSGRIRSNMLKAIKLLPHGVTKHPDEQDKIYKQMLKDTQADRKLYQIGGNE